MLDPGTHLVCQQLSRNRIENGECTYCGKKVKLKDITAPCGNCIDRRRRLLRSKIIHFIKKKFFYNILQLITMFTR